MTMPPTCAGRFCPSPSLVVQHLHRFREGQNAVVGGHLVERALQGAFGAGAVVAADIDDERVIEFALVLNLLNYAAYFIVGVGGIGGEDFRLARVEFLLNQRERVPPAAALRRHKRPVRPAMA